MILHFKLIGIDINLTTSNQKVEKKIATSTMLEHGASSQLKKRGKSLFFFAFSMTLYKQSKLCDA